MKKFDSYDGGPLIEMQSNGTVKQLDLTLPHYHLPIYDWVICLEVIEHIPEQYEDIVVDNLIRHASRGIIMSWANEGQLGYFHVNGRKPAYVDEKMRSRCFLKNDTQSQILKRAATLWWLQNNTNVYYRAETCP